MVGGARPLATLQPGDVIATAGGTSLRIGTTSTGATTIALSSGGPVATITRADLAGAGSSGGAAGRRRLRNAAGDGSSVVHVVDGFVDPPAAIAPPPPPPPCDAAGLKCCAGVAGGAPTCNGTALQCDADTNECIACGAAGAVCCAGTAPCGGNAALECDAATSTCVACGGGDGARCCAGDTPCSGDPELTCGETSEECEACGASGEPCCLSDASSTKCDVPLACYNAQGTQPHMCECGGAAGRAMLRPRGRHQSVLRRRRPRVRRRVRVAHVCHAAVRGA